MSQQEQFIKNIDTLIEQLEEVKHLVEDNPETMTGRDAKLMLALLMSVSENTGQFAKNMMKAVPMAILPKEN